MLRNTGYYLPLLIADLDLDFQQLISAFYLLGLKHLRRFQFNFGEIIDRDSFVRHLFLLNSFIFL